MNVGHGFGVGDVGVVVGCFWDSTEGKIHCGIYENYSVAYLFPTYVRSVLYLSCPGLLMSGRSAANPDL